MTQDSTGVYPEELGNGASNAPAEVDSSRTRGGSRSMAGPVALACMLAGGALQGHANHTPDALLVATTLFAAGIALVSAVFPKSGAEVRAFMLSYGLCVLLGGLAQNYSLEFLGVLQSTIDAPTFYSEISATPPFTTMADLHPNFNSKLAVILWQYAYAVTWWVGLDYGPYTGVQLNALVVGFSGALTVRTARELFGNDPWRLRRVGTLCAWCGMFWLFGAVFLRDCFTLFLNTAVLWALARWLRRPNVNRVLFMALVVGLSSWAMLYFRQKSVVLFGLFGALAFSCWYLRGRLNPMRLLVISILPIGLLFGYVYLDHYIQTSLEYGVEKAEAYREFGEERSGDDSLGLRLVVNQPLPIRLVLGSGSMLLYPIPLWAYWQPGALDYDLLKSFQGVFQVVVAPLLLAGLLLAIRRIRARLKQESTLLFIVLYASLSLVSVVATTLETRHLGQFIPAFLILAAIPDTRVARERRLVRDISIVWIGVVLSVHALWWFARS